MKADSNALSSVKQVALEPLSPAELNTVSGGLELQERFMTYTKWFGRWLPVGGNEPFIPVDPDNPEGHNPN